MTWLIIAALVGFGFGRYGFGWVADAVRWVYRKVRPGQATDHHPV